MSTSNGRYCGDGISGVFLTVTEFINKLDINQLILSQPDYNCHMNMHMIAYVYIHKCIMYNYKYIHIIANMYIYIHMYMYTHDFECTIV